MFTTMIVNASLCSFANSCRGNAGSRLDQSEPAFHFGNGLTFTLTVSRLLLAAPSLTTKAKT
jgi:hypothetical protein